MLIVLVIVLLLFGSRLPSTMRSLGRGVTEFKKGLAGEGDEDENPPKVKDDAKQQPPQQ
jgi:sec-independent protein translocase protein TatA